MANGKKRVAVLFGGRSSEHEVSLRSAASILEALDSSRYTVLPVGLDRDGRWYGELLPKGFQPKEANELEIPVHCTGGSAELKWRHGSRSPLVVDVFFPALHGPLYEDGALQGILENMDAAFVGAGVLGSAVAMDKDVTKRLLAQGGVRVVPYLKVSARRWPDDLVLVQQKVAKELGYPVFVKPNNTGSSVGVHKVKSADGLAAAVADALTYDEVALIEKGIDAREIELSALESRSGELARISVPGEIVPRHEFYSYEAKYLDPEGAKLQIPAGLSQSQIQEVTQIAQKTFDLLNCSGMARVDLFLDRQSNHFFLNEINTLPGFTSISMYPKLWEASGLKYSDLLTELVELAWERAQRKRTLKREWAP